MTEFSNNIKAYALQNFLEFGKADPSKILPKLFQHGLTKDRIKEVMPEIQEIVKTVNVLKKADAETLFNSLNGFIKETREEKQGLPELPNAGKKMVLRMAPFPSGALHIGNAKTFLLNALYAEKYAAKLLLLIDDTIGSEEKQPVKEGYVLIPEAADLLGIKYHKPILYKSDRLKIYYEYAKKLIEKGHAYVCYCTQDVFRDHKEKGIECSCRQFPSKIQLARWKQMFKDDEGHAVLRIKTGMQHPNPAFRDRVLFKISDRKHPRVGNKYRVWPSLEMSWSIDDHLLGITHILRGNDLMIETDMEKFIWNIFGWKHPETIHTGLIKLDGAEVKLSKSKAQKEVREGTFTGWDDPRTWSIESLIRRGITKEAIRMFVEEIGLNKADITVPIDALYAANRRVIDARANRYYFVHDPVKLMFDKPVPVTSVMVPIHPDKSEMREIELKDVFISKKDFQEHNGTEVRLLHLFNIKLGNKTKITSVENKKIPRIQWVSESVIVKILMPDGQWIEGRAEKAVGDLKKDTVIQFERFGFVRYDKTTNGALEFWYAHP
jgi:glutamyl-tRNA synthetase